MIALILFGIFSLMAIMAIVNAIKKAPYIEEPDQFDSSGS